MDLSEMLERLYGYTAYRPGQQRSIQSIIDRKDTLSILPTSTGKSLVYEMASHVFRTRHPDKTVFVVSPLISLMADQVSQCPSHLSSVLLGTAQRDAEDVEGRMWQATYDLVFLSPEKLGSLASRHGAALSKIMSLLVVDEAHCVSMDGRSFRPSYLDIGDIRSAHLTGIPILALTATASRSPRRRKPSCSQASRRSTKRRWMRSCDMRRRRWPSSGGSSGPWRSRPITGWQLACLARSVSSATRQKL